MKDATTKQATIKKPPRVKCECGSTIRVLFPDFWKCVCGKKTFHTDEERLRLAEIQSQKKSSHESAQWTPLNYSVRGNEGDAAAADPAVREALATLNRSPKT